jgi:hypothetical protein
MLRCASADQSGIFIGIGVAPSDTTPPLKPGIKSQSGVAVCRPANFPFAAA